MSHLITLETLDQDGAIRETAEAAGATRADFLKRGGMAGAGFLAGGVLFQRPPVARSRGDADLVEAQVQGERHPDRQLRAHARVPRG